jgi:hypothetical protein
MNAIAKIYWRNIKNGNRTFESIPANVKDDVKTLAKQDVVDGVITAEEYKEYIGEDYEG